MAENGQEILEKPRNTDPHPLNFSSNSYEHDVDKEARLRGLKERQNEERQKKLEELRAQALAAQRFKEQKEFERRRRLEDMRVKDDQRRHLVEERKKAINEAERDRLESILRRNQERDARIEAKKRNERSSIVFAFGSSTPRMLDPTDVTVSFWGHRRATSTQNITISSSGSSLTRRQSERDLDASSKKRATSAGGLERAAEGLISPTTPAGCASGYIGRRRTDLVPTIPSRDSSFHSSTSRKSLNHSPGRAYSMSRLDQLAKPRKPVLPALNESNMAPKSSVTRSMSHLAHVGTKLSPRKPLSKTDSRSMHHLSPDAAHPPIAPPRVNRATQLRQQKLLLAQQSSSASEASSRPSSAMSQQSTNSVTSSVNVRHRLSTTPRRPRPASIAITGVTHDKNSIDKGEHKPPLPKTRKPLSKTNTSEKIEKTKTKPAKSPAEESAPKITAEQKKEDKTEKKQEVGPQKVQPLPQRVEASPPEKELDVSQVQTKEPSPPPLIATQDIEAPKSQVIESTAQHQEDRKVTTTEQLSPQQDNIIQNFIDSERKAAEQIVGVQKTDENSAIVSNNEKHEEKDETKDVKQDNSDTISSEMTTSISKPRITTEEEAKAALAERRRLIREEAERQAELERQRIEAEQKAEFERQQREEEQARLLAEMQRQSEQERLQEAIREAQRREEEERLRREEEARQKILKEEADKKAKEEAERQKAELQKKLENEEKEREERRKRVEMIMSRTRGKNNANLPSQNSQDKTKPENKQVTEEDKLNEDNKVNENKLNGSQQENGTNDTSTKNGKDMGIVDNIIPDDSLKNANTTVTDTLNSDSINSNSAWQPTQQYGNLLYNNNS
ncbi:MAP7 domain-containing protein 1-like isoform X3 [Sitophilus oryzae]|uniref:MAP7 domain-containing protein 1-like isoform X3 n=1 Tax=Sitophilus oryzae TaxID=7048 RepID=A0A6J2X550_SITOR|nr:MAP7 domain-containing protein 1-like isoform X3 [Sitophilus oryzae]